MTTTNNTETKTPMLTLFAAASNAARLAPFWNPTARPYRVTLSLPNAHQPHKTISAMFATESEARNAFSATLPRGATEVVIDLATNTENWSTEGRCCLLY